MAGVFKSLDLSDVRITPFRTYKLWADQIGNGDSGSVYTIYKANYNPVSNFTNVDPLRDTFDQGNPLFTNNEPTTSFGKYQRVVHRSIDHIYYRDFYTNYKASFGSGNINTQVRYLEDQAIVVSMPQSKFGEMILPGSVKMTLSWSLGCISSSAIVSGTWDVIDDDNGNLYISGSDYFSVYGQYVGGAYTNYSSSVNRDIVGEWPFDDVYKYVGEGDFNTTTDFNRGRWVMESSYSNVNASFITSSLSQSDAELLGAVLNFTASNSSSIEIKASQVSAYKQHYNFQGSDFAISLITKPTQLPTHPSGSILIAKQGPIEAPRTDENGNPYTLPVPNKSPYRLTYMSGSGKILFEKDPGNTIPVFALTSSISMSLDNIHHIVATRSGSLMSLYISNGITSSLDTATVTVSDRDCSNDSGIYIGNSYTGAQGFNGVIDNVKLYKQSLSSNDVKILFHTLGVGNVLAGNVFYNHGMMTLTSIPMRYATASRVDTRGTHTIWETEVLCTINPGDFQMSNNPTLQTYNPQTNEYEFTPFVTSSAFKPFVTTVGLYDDRGRLLVIGKLNQPIQLPNNIDTTIVIRYDR